MKRLIGVYRVRPAGRGMTVVLPSDWAERNGVKPGQQVRLYDNGGILIMEAQRVPAES